MTLEEIFSELHALVDTDAQLAPLPFLGQIASAVADATAVREYNKHLENALSGEGEGNPGVALVAVVSEGDDAEPEKAILDLWNVVMLSVVVNPKKNTTGLTAFQLTRRVMRVCKGAKVASRGARTDVRLSKPAFNVGPLNQGTDIFFVNLLVRTTENLGPINPA